MLPVLGAEEMRSADRATIERGTPGSVLMENAGAAVARIIRARFPSVRRPLVVCGKGHNGGDGLVVARHLLSGHRPGTLLLGRRKDLKNDVLHHLGLFEAAGGNLTEVPDDGAWEAAKPWAFEADLVVDAMLGTGLRNEPSGILARLIADFEDLRRRGVPIVSVDIPSGLSSDTGDLAWPAVTASLTVSFAAPKYGHVMPPACDHVGELLVVDIGVARPLLEACGSKLWLLEAEDAARAYPPRRPGGHKGDYGHVLVVAGAVGKTGAAVLAGLGALRAGAGLVTVATPAPAQPIVAASRPELMTEPLTVAPDGGLGHEALARTLLMAAQRQAVVVGPGLGQEPSTREFILELVRRCPAPLVVDADGLNALVGAEDAAAILHGREKPTVLTPHPGEMARLAGSSTTSVQARRLATARACAQKTGALVVLKGQRTIVADAQGRAAVNPTGNPAMAAGGMGDVLAGVIGALLARGLDPWTAATSGVYVHGLAGDHAAAARGVEGLLAGEVADALPAAIRSLEVAHS